MTKNLRRFIVVRNVGRRLIGLGAKMMTKFQKAVFQMVKQEEKENLWQGYENCRVGRSISSSIRIYVKGFKKSGYSVYEVYKFIDDINKYE
ncbi:hypothetical protein [Clostridioides difficile]|uniref:hypothetical protein n=1 Tax=Clostridioides difficile TaxID=1496 RepID=UPI0021C37140|nr:hypothetical protein [Clostridioides difficile]MDX5761172.1 hypothetical protein [Clostridioides difficile]UUC40678.1 hypothetical protein NMZ80_12465 [Clostridioides difficile]